MFQIAERLHQPLAVVERMTLREVQGWIDYWRQSSQAAPVEVDADADAIDMATLSKVQLRAMFPGR